MINKYPYTLLYTLLLTTTLLSVDTLAETGKRPDVASAKNGKPLYETYCQSCHGEQGVGEPAPPMSIRDPSFFFAPALDDSQHAWHHSDEDLVKFILEGSPRTPRMVAWKKVLSRTDVRNIVAYIKSLWGDRAIKCQGPKHMSCM
ncbi:MAG TPA: cytochrome c [Gammaproteobacteria bacterium]|nr:cytochrome c [Gammaproteobacteria bacterium]